MLSPLAAVLFPGASFSRASPKSSSLTLSGFGFGFGIGICIEPEIAAGTDIGIRNWSELEVGREAEMPIELEQELASDVEY